MLPKLRRALILYITAGDPLINTKLVSALYQSGMDILEVGLPVARPKYDGPVIRRSMRRALASLSGLDDALDSAVKLPGDNKILFTYYDEALKYGVEDFFSRVSSGFGSVLFPDLLIDHLGELERYSRLCEKYGVAQAFFITTGFPHKLVKRLSSLEPAFIYLGLMVSTGVLLPISAGRNIRLFRELVGSVPLIVGFAVRSPEQVEQYMQAGADGVVVGSALLRILEEAGEDEKISRVCGFVAELKRAVERHGYTQQ
ncbi:MAG: tryptophan synthase subunit alpha [Aigarchaeota archaeon]|nr:tryptophan synthase subunit alpha [Candidatus Pelearchaeum maunauluense]